VRLVMWSKLSVKSEYVKDEATYALNRSKLVPVKIEEVELPFRFERLHTMELLGWDGSKDSAEYRKLVTDIAAIIGDSANILSELSQGAMGAPDVPVFRDTLKDGSQGPEMVVVPEGKFKMGDLQGEGKADERPVHGVCISKPFGIGRCEITFEEYDLFVTVMQGRLPTDQGWVEVGNRRSTCRGEMR
jgi:formylglycine-generating enzyme required for sulfatase activity